MTGLRQLRTMRLPQNSLFCDVAKLRKPSLALNGATATIALALNQGFNSLLSQLRVCQKTETEKQHLDK
jgi:hypothetical protein